MIFFILLERARGGGAMTAKLIAPRTLYSAMCAQHFKIPSNCNPSPFLYYNCSFNLQRCIIWEIQSPSAKVKSDKIPHLLLLCLTFKLDLVLFIHAKWLSSVEIYFAGHCPLDFILFQCKIFASVIKWSFYWESQTKTCLFRHLCGLNDPKWDIFESEWDKEKISHKWIENFCFEWLLKEFRSLIYSSEFWINLSIY